MSHTSMSRRHKLWIFAVSALAFAQAVASFLLPNGRALMVWTDVSQVLLLASGTFALGLNVAATSRRTRLFWSLMTLGIACWLAYQVSWTCFEVFLRQDVPNPFVGDIVLVLHIVPMMAALALQPHIGQDERTLRMGSLDFALLLVWWLYLYIIAVIPWQYVHINEVAYSQNLNEVYLAEKTAFLVALAVVGSRCRGSWKTIYLHWFGATLIYALVSYFANWAIAQHVYYSGSLYDLPIAASMAWVTAIGVLALELAPTEQPAKKSSGHGAWVAHLGMVTIFSLPLFAAWSAFDSAAPPAGRTFRLIVSLCAIMLMGAMVFRKQYLLGRELLGLLRTSEESFGNLRRLQAQLVQSEKLASLGQLVGGAAHELNNPLTAMLGYSELLSATPLSPEQRDMAEKIVYQVRRTKTLVSSLLSFAKQVPSEKTLLDLNSLTMTTVKLCQPQLRAANIQLRTAMSDNLPQVLGDSNQLLQVCLHVTNNALNAMSQSGGVLAVSTRLHEGWVLLEFSDSGPGIQAPGRVFDPFYTTRPVGQGTGLGLSACYGIIQEHGGRILCENRPEGGATFRIELPPAGASSTRVLAPPSAAGASASAAKG